METVVLHPDKGKKGGKCNRTACQRDLSEDHIWWNQYTHAFYCSGCAREINKWSDLGPICVEQK